ncbi:MULTISPECIES: SDR family NAD(P)-dependent oxidoreductase [Bhargavaea]|uniref:SDR family NAD(P)-dependent oxidoreductase n=1 Tax=Bhargavaea changchunensis TaxID=2134037 RepID=A0ABW2NCA2_9BACL|nr:SDR family NAD(P)-dependent oxidoreductase [Bhargavaea sp. CC-171006]
MKKHKRVLVTGATGGIGRAVVKDLLREGHLVLATGRNPDILSHLYKMGAGVIESDLTTKEGLDRVTAAAGAPDVVIFGAGVGTFLHAHELTDTDISQTMEVNSVSPMKLLSRILPGMIERGSGHIIFIASAAGKVSTKKTAVYSASKGAILGYADALRLEMAAHGLEVTTVNPGPVDTPFLDHVTPGSRYRESMKGYMISPEQVSKAIITVMGRPIREVDLPWYMAAVTRIHSIAPNLTEKIGRNFFEKK